MFACDTGQVANTAPMAGAVLKVAAVSVHPPVMGAKSIAPETVKSHVKHIFTTTGSSSRATRRCRVRRVSSNGNRFLLHAPQWAVSAASANSAVKSTNR